MEEEKSLKKTEKKEHGAEKHDKKDGRRSLGSTLGDYRGEYNKIIWPSKEDLVKETMVVLVTCVILGAIIVAFDLVYSNGYSLLIGALVK